MAGEWLKFDSTLPEKQETLAITVAMGWDDPDLTVGKLMRLFRWFDQHTIDGNAASVTPALLDRIVGVTGFVSAVAAQRWLVIEDGGISLHNFERHNGATAKSRALTAKRVANHKTNATGNARGNAATVSGALPREEKRREEKNKEGKGSAVAPHLASIPEKLLQDFLTLRKAKKAGALTETALKGIEREGKKAGLTLVEAITACCEFSWQGFNAQWYADRGTPKGASKFPDKADTIRQTVADNPDIAATAARLAADAAIPRSGPTPEQRARLEELRRGKAATAH